MRYRELQNGIKPAIPMIFLFDNAGAQSFDSVGVFHTWDTTKIITDHFTYTADSDRIYLSLQSAGLFIIEFDCSFITYDDDADMYVETELYKNGSLVTGGRSVIGVTGAADQNPLILNSQSIHYVIYLEKDDYIQIKSTTSANTARSLEQTSRLLIHFVPMQGWDNGSNAGRTEYKGGVMR